MDVFVEIYICREQFWFCLCTLFSFSFSSSVVCLERRASNTVGRRSLSQPRGCKFEFIAAQRRKKGNFGYVCLHS